MNRAGRVALSIITGGVVAVILASACIIAYSQYNRAEDLGSENAGLESDLASTNLELDTTESNLDLTTDSLSETQDKLMSTQATLDDTTATLTTTTQQRDSLSSRATACRWLVRVNDRLLTATIAQQNSTGALMKGHHRAALRAQRRAAAHLRQVQRIVKWSGNKSISGLVNDCTPPSWAK